MAKKINRSKTEQDFIKATGTPTSMLLPARNYRFKVYNKEYCIELPRSGVYEDLAPKNFTKEDGEFNLLQYDKSKKQHIFYFPALSRVLFATAQYPELADNQAFTPIAIVFKKDKVELIGNIIEMLEEDYNEM